MIKIRRSWVRIPPWSEFCPRVGTVSISGTSPVQNLARKLLKICRLYLQLLRTNENLMRLDIENSIIRFLVKDSQQETNL